MTMLAPKYRVETEPVGEWSYIVGPNGYREGPIRYAWEAQEWADEMNRGDMRPATLERVRAHGENARIKKEG